MILAQSVILCIDSDNTVINNYNKNNTFDRNPKCILFVLIFCEYILHVFNVPIVLLLSTVWLYYDIYFMHFIITIMMLYNFKSK